MKKPILLACSLAVVAAANTGGALAQAYKPSRSIEFVTHSGPGGGGDVFGRAIIAAMDKEKLMPVRMQMVNKTGGSGSTAMAYLAEKQGDTHTIAVFTSIWYTTPLMRSEAKYSMKDMTPLVRLVLEPAVVAVKSDAPYKTLKDFIDAAQKNPGQLKQSGGSIGARDWVLRQLLMKNTGANWSFISFPGGGERIAAVLGGHVNIMILEPQEAGEHIRSGNMRVIAQVSEKRLPSLPNVPTVKEAGFDVPNAPQVRGIVAPPRIPPEAVGYWEDLFARLNKTASWRKFLEDNLLEDGYQRSGELARFGDTFADTMRGILKEGGLKVVR